jgi:hypothetical protein
VSSTCTPSAGPIGQSGRAGGSRRVFGQFVWLEAGFVEVALSRPTYSTPQKHAGNNVRPLGGVTRENIVEQRNHPWEYI